jgi:hypothetical protein
MNARRNNNVVILKNKLLSLSLRNNDILKNRISTLSSSISPRLVSFSLNKINYSNNNRLILSSLSLQTSLSIRYNSTISSSIQANTKTNTNTNNNNTNILKKKKKRKGKDTTTKKTSSLKDDKNDELNIIPLILNKQSLLSSSSSSSSSSSITINNIDEFVTFSMTHLKNNESDELIELMTSIINGNKLSLLNGKRGKSYELPDDNTYRIITNRIVDTIKGIALFPLAIDTSLMKKVQQNLQEVLIACHNKKFNTITITNNDNNNNNVSFTKMKEVIDISNKAVSILPLVESNELINELVDYSKGNISLSLLLRYN